MMKKIENIELKNFREFVRFRISSIRNSKDFSARNLSLELNRSSEYINQIENSRMQPTLEFLFDFCTFFNITLSEFFDSFNAHPLQFREICQDLSCLSEEEVCQVSSIIKTIAKGKR